MGRRAISAGGKVPGERRPPRRPAVVRPSRGRRRRPAQSPGEAGGLTGGEEVLRVRPPALPRSDSRPGGGFPLPDGIGVVWSEDVGAGTRRGGASAGPLPGPNRGTGSPGQPGCAGGTGE